MASKHLRNPTAWKVAIFTVAIATVGAMLIVVFGQFRFAADNVYNATFADSARLKVGQDVRMAGMAVGTTHPVRRAAGPFAWTVFRQWVRPEPYRSCGERPPWAAPARYSRRARAT